MQYPVPQFIDVEDKIIGPFTLKQFGFIFSGGVLIVALFRLLRPGIAFYTLSIPIALVDVFVSFGKFNGRPIYDTFPIIIKFVTSDRLLIFQQKKVSLDNISIQPLESIKIEPEKKEEIVEPVHSRLKKLSMLLDQKNQEELEALSLAPGSAQGAQKPQPLPGSPEAKQAALAAAIASNAAKANSQNSQNAQTPPQAAAQSAQNTDLMAQAAQAQAASRTTQALPASRISEPAIRPGQYSPAAKARAAMAARGPYITPTSNALGKGTH